jgi:hypothetical protein
MMAVRFIASGPARTTNMAAWFITAASAGHFGTTHWVMKGRNRSFGFDRHCFVEGEYVSITEHDGVQRTFRVTEAVPVP